MVLYYIKTLFKNYLFYKNDFKHRLENLKEFSLFLYKNNIEYCVCGGFIIFLLKGRIYRETHDIDLRVERKYAKHLLKVLEEEKIPVTIRERYGTFFFKWKDIAYDVHFFTSVNGSAKMNFIFGHGNNWKNIKIVMPQGDMLDNKHHNELFKKYKIRVAGPASNFVMLGLQKNAGAKKLDIYYLKKYVSKDALHRILELNPEHRDVFDFGLLDYSLLRWIKDELCGILSKFRN